MKTEKCMAHLFLSHVYSLAWPHGLGLPDSSPSPSRLCLSASSSANTPVAGWCGLTLPFLLSPTLSCSPTLMSLARQGLVPAHRSLFCSCTNTTKPHRLPGAGPALHRRLRAFGESAAQLGQKPGTPGWASQLGIPRPLSSHLQTPFPHSLSP